MRRTTLPLSAVALLLCACVTTARRDLNYALQPGADWFVNYQGDGTAAGDSAAAIASAAGTELEGGDTERGLRLFREALRRGVPDSLFYRDGIGVAKNFRDAALEALVVREARRRFPSESWPP